MKKILLVALLLMAGGAAFAQQEKGDFQVQAQGAYYSNSSGGQSIAFGTLYLSASRFVTDNIEVGIQPVFTFGDYFSSVNLAFFGNYSFLTSDAKMVPYVGAQIMFYGLGTDPDASQTGFGLKGGLRYFVTEKVNIDVGPSISFLSSPGGYGDGTTLFTFIAGIGYIFGRN